MRLGMMVKARVRPDVVLLLAEAVAVAVAAVAALDVEHVA